MNIRILVIEDDVEINQLVTRYLGKEGYRTDGVYNGKEALFYLSKYEYQLIILDLMLPRVDGQEVLRIVRAKKPFRLLFCLQETAKWIKYPV